MGLLANLKLRRKLLIALLPLAIMVIVVGAYSSIQSKRIDTWYSDLFDTQVEGLRSVSEARSHTNRFGMFLFELVAETDPARRPAIDAELDKIRADYQSVIAEAVKGSPSAQTKSRRPRLSSIKPFKTHVPCAQWLWRVTIKWPSTSCMGV